MRILFVKDRLAWPRSSGHDVHSFFCMRGLSELGHEIALATIKEAPSGAALEGLPLAECLHFDATAENDAVGQVSELNRVQERFRSYWGVTRAQIDWVAKSASRFQADAVVVVGLGVLPYLAAVRGARRIWYAGDEWVWHHLSQIRIREPRTWPQIHTAFIKGLYERIYAPLVDGVWVVSEADARSMQRVTGHRRIDVIPNGVDAMHYVQPKGETEPYSCVFWGRLDFGPNIQALQWYCRTVWPAVIRILPQAVFRIYGFQLTKPVAELASIPGITITPDLADIREPISRCQVVVLPFVSGGGVKNKLLEAAALARPIVGTPAACNGLRHQARHPLRIAHSTEQWVETLCDLWSSQAVRHNLGIAARNWVTSEHNWEITARTAEDSLLGTEAKFA